MKMHFLFPLLLLQNPLACNEAIDQEPTVAAQDSLQVAGIPQVETNSLVFRSADGGETWDNISQGLPEKVGTLSSFADGSGLYMLTGNELYRSAPGASVPFWTQEIVPDPHCSIAPGQTGMFAYTYGGQVYQRTLGMPVWTPVFGTFENKAVHTVYESNAGTIFIGSDAGIFKSDDGGTTWKQVNDGGWVREIVESNGIMIATSQGGILRSADGGEHWDFVIREGGVGINVSTIKGGFTAIAYNTTIEKRRIWTSYDGGLKWHPIDDGLQSFSIASLVEVGDYFFCGHPKGVYRSSDKGKTWKLILPAQDNKVFNLFVSGGVLYAVNMDGGC